MTVGIVQFFQGLAAVAENEVFVVGIDYVYQFDLTTWGWIHLVLGALVALVGLALFTGAAWARVSAVVICAISIIANFLWLPYYPWWSTLIIALNIVVIWLCRHGSPPRRRTPLRMHRQRRLDLLELKVCVGGWRIPESRYWPMTCCSGHSTR